MSSVLLGMVVALSLSGASLLGLFLRALLPDHHLQSDSKDVIIIRLATAVVGTLSALALGFLIASAKTTNDTADSEFRASSARVVLLDRLMSHYGPDADPSRVMLRRFLKTRLRRGWTPAPPISAGGMGEEVEDMEAVQNFLRQLNPKTEPQHLLQARMLEVSGILAESQWLTAETGDESLPWGFLTVLVFWLALLFGTFGMQAPANPTVICILLVCAISVGGAVFLIADMANPYLGLIHISDTPLREALDRLGEH